MKNSKKISTGIYLVIFSAFIFSCGNDYSNDPLLEEALQAGGTNRSELEKVLRHYSDPEDSLKYQAAVFLIKYMPGKFAKVFHEYNNYVSVFDTLETLNTSYEKIYKPNNAEFYKFYKRTVFNYFMTKHQIKNTNELGFEIKEDVETITADYLIENINYAFKAWEMPWNTTLSFNEFCEYILPYRYGNEELQPWRKTCYENNIHLLDSFINKNEHDPINVCMALKGLHDVSRSEINELRGLGNAIKTLDLIRINTTTSCKDETGVVMIKLRALGVPVSRLTLPNWGNWGSGHDINGVLTLDKKWFPLNQGTNPSIYIPQYKTAKVFLELYSNNKNSTYISCHKDDCNINPIYADVSGYVTEVTDLSIPFENVKDGTMASLCVFNNAAWIPIVSSVVNNGTASFPQVGRRIIYMPATVIEGKLELKGQPFLLDSTGVVKTIRPSAGNQTITLSRKYPPNDILNKFVLTLNGCYFQGSNDNTFANAETLWKIDNLEDLHTIGKSIKNAKFQYVRLVFPDIERENQGLGGIQFYREEANGKNPLEGEPISSVKASDTFYKHVFDNNPLTFIQLLTRSNVDFNQFYDGESLVIPDRQPFWVGLKFKTPVEITALGFSPRTDDNDVNVGEPYEFFYWDKDWVSLGIKTATENKISFDVPGNALYLLKNAEKGREHRIFLYQDNKQVWF